jgi:hypothetical protein
MITSPQQGQNLHAWILQESRNLLIEGYNSTNVIRILSEATKNSGRTSQNLQQEIINSVEGAVAWLIQNPGATVKRRRQSGKKVDPTNYFFKDVLYHRDSRERYLKPDAAIRKKVLESVDYPPVTAGFGLDEFGYLKLFANINFLICACVRVDRPEILPLKRWLSIGMQSQQFVVPNYCLEVRRGKCDDNMGKSLYQVIEFDQDSLEDQWKLLWKLDEELPLGMVVHSGHKSLHGWFPCFHLGRREIRSFVRLATELGADPMLRIPSQYVRMPLGRNRKTMQIQNILYFNLEIINAHNVIVRRRCL